MRRDGPAQEAAGVLDAYPNDIGPTMAYSRALMEFQVGGDGEAARSTLAAALAQNRFVPEYLLRPVEDAIDSYQIGSEDEAIVSANEMLAAWQATPGALGWLEERVRAMRTERRAAARRKDRKAGRRR